MKVWITKYALTDGIQEAEAETCGDVSAKMIEVRTPGSLVQYFHGEGKDWHRTEKDAIKRALVMAEKKEKSLRKELNKIAQLNVSFGKRRNEIGAW